MAIDITPDQQKEMFPTTRASTSRNIRMYFNVLVQQIDVLLISSQNKIQIKCLVNIFLMSIFFCCLEVEKLRSKKY